MKTENLLFKALVTGGIIVAAANFRPEVLAATPLTDARKTTLSGAIKTDIGTAVKTMLEAAPAADRFQLAKDIVTYVAGKGTLTPKQLQSLLKAAVAAVPGHAAEIAVAAVKALTNAGAALKASIMAIAKGAFEGAPSELSDIAEALISEQPQFREDIQRLLRSASEVNNPSNISNPKDSSAS